MQRARAVRGFTLIELLVVIVILVVIASFVTIGFQNYVARQQFETAKVEVRSLLRETRQRSLAAVGDETHGVYFSGSTITQFRGSHYDAAASSNVTTDLLGVSITPALTGGTTTILFSRLAGAPTATGTVVLTGLRTGAVATVTVSTTGIIE